MAFNDDDRVRVVHGHVWSVIRMGKKPKWKQEKTEHPWLTRRQAKQVVREHKGKRKKS
jgi:hypothetical protein